MSRTILRGRRPFIATLVCAMMATGGWLTATVSSAAAAGTPTLYYITDASNNQGYSVSINQAFDAAVAAAKARGGVKHQGLNVVKCDAQSNNNAAAACAQAAASAGAFAIVDQAQEASVIPYAQQANIPVFSEGLSTESLSNPVSFVLADGSLEGSAGFVPSMKKAGCTALGMLATVNPASADSVRRLSDSMQTAAQKLHIAYKGLITAPITAADLSPYVTEAVTNGMQCIYPLAFGPAGISVLASLQSLVSQGKIKKVAICSCLVTPQTASAMGPSIRALGKNAVLTLGIESDLNTSNPAVKQWVHDEYTYSTTATKPFLEFQGGMQWAELQLAIRAAAAVSPNITGRSVLSWLKKQTNYWPGIIPPLSLAKSPPNGYGPRVLSAWVAPTVFPSSGLDFPRTGPFVSVLTGKTSNNPVPAGCKKWVNGGCSS